MSLELLYTSAPRGLMPGSRGFCTVAATRGMPAALMEKLESLSGYRPLYPPLDPNAHLNPVVHSHVRISVAGRTYQVLSRIGSAGLDYSERSNKLAHHIVLDQVELGEASSGGPAWLLQQPGVLESDWDGEVGWRPAGPALPGGIRFPHPAMRGRLLQAMPAGRASWSRLSSATQRDRRSCFSIQASTRCRSWQKLLPFCHRNADGRFRSAPITRRCPKAWSATGGACRAIRPKPRRPGNCRAPWCWNSGRAAPRRGERGSNRLEQASR